MDKEQEKYKQTDTSWKLYNYNNRPGGARAPDQNSRRDDHSDALKGHLSPRQYLENLRAQSACSSSKKK